MQRGCHGQPASKPGAARLRAAALRGVPGRGLRRAMTVVLAGVLGSMAASQVLAQPVMKPGLWEVRIKSPEFAAMRKQMQEQLAQLSPAQRTQMEKMMGGNAIGMMAGGPIRICHTEASLKSRGPIEQERGCTVQTSARGATHIVDMKCVDGRTGHGEFVHTAETYRGFLEATDPGRPGRMRMEHEGRWVAADCGNVKPAP